MVVMKQEVFRAHGNVHISVINQLLVSHFVFFWYLTALWIKMSVTAECLFVSSSIYTSPLKV